MTTELLEKQFFECFGIEQKSIYVYLVMDMGKSYICDKTTIIINKHLFKEKSRRCYIKAVNKKKYYPEITAEILLNLICILSEYSTQKYLNEINSIEELKMNILDHCMYLYNEYYKEDLNVKEFFKQQVRKLFEGEE